MCRLNAKKKNKGTLFRVKRTVEHNARIEREFTYLANTYLRLKSKKLGSSKYKNMGNTVEEVQPSSHVCSKEKGGEI